MPIVNAADDQTRQAMLKVWQRGMRTMSDQTERVAATNVNRVGQKVKAIRQLEDMNAAGANAQYTVGDYGDISIRSAPVSAASSLDTERLASDKRYSATATEVAGGNRRDVTATPAGTAIQGDNIESAMQQMVKPSGSPAANVVWTPEQQAADPEGFRAALAQRLAAGAWWQAGQPQTQSTIQPPYKPDAIPPTPSTSSPSASTVMQPMGVLKDNQRVTTTTNVGSGRSISGGENWSNSHSINEGSMRPASLQTNVDIQSVYDPTNERYIQDQQTQAALGRIRSQFYSGLGLSQPGETTAQEATAMDNLKRRDTAVSSFNQAAGGSKMQAVFSSGQYGGGGQSRSAGYSYNTSLSDNNSTSTSVSRGPIEKYDNSGNLDVIGVTGNKTTIKKFADGSGYQMDAGDSVPFTKEFLDKQGFSGMSDEQINKRIQSFIPSGTIVRGRDGKLYVQATKATKISDPNIIDLFKSMTNIKQGNAGGIGIQATGSNLTEQQMRAMRQLPQYKDKSDSEIMRMVNAGK